MKTSTLSFLKLRKFYIRLLNCRTTTRLIPCVIANFISFFKPSSLTFTSYSSATFFLSSLSALLSSFSFSLKFQHFQTVSQIRALFDPLTNLLRQFHDQRQNRLNQNTTLKTAIGLLALWYLLGLKWILPTLLSVNKWAIHAIPPLPPKCHEIWYCNYQYSWKVMNR